VAKFEIAPGLTFVSRASWSPKPEHPRQGKTVARDKRTHVFIHHTCMKDRDDSTPNIWESESEIFSMMRELQTCRPELSLDVPYNFVAFMTTINDGLYICEGRGEDRSGAHTVGHNTAAIAVSFAGDFETLPIPSAEIAKRMAQLSAFLGWLRHDASHPDYGQFEPMRNLETRKPPQSGRKVWYHRDVKSTDCPGSKLIAHLPSVGFVRPE
jgi:peptidoglycan recognition protein